jgi:hypothetical protein
VVPDQRRNIKFVGSPASFKDKFSDDRKTVSGRWE